MNRPATHARPVKSSNTNAKRLRRNATRPRESLFLPCISHGTAWPMSRNKVLKQQLFLSPRHFCALLYHPIDNFDPLLFRQVFVVERPDLRRVARRTGLREDLGSVVGRDCDEREQEPEHREAHQYEQSLGYFHVPSFHHGPEVGWRRGPLHPLASGLISILWISP